jgi:hypothetical protein
VRAVFWWETARFFCKMPEKQALVAEVRRFPAKNGFLSDPGVKLHRLLNGLGRRFDAANDFNQGV